MMTARVSGRLAVSFVMNQLLMMTVIHCPVSSTQPAHYNYVAACLMFVTRQWISGYCKWKVVWLCTMIWWHLASNTQCNLWCW